MCFQRIYRKSDRGDCVFFFSQFSIFTYRCTNIFKRGASILAAFLVKPLFHAFQHHHQSSSPSIQFSCNGQIRSCRQYIAGGAAGRACCCLCLQWQGTVLQVYTTQHHRLDLPWSSSVPYLTATQSKADPWRSASSRSFTGVKSLTMDSSIGKMLLWKEAPKLRRLWSNQNQVDA